MVKTVNRSRYSMERIKRSVIGKFSSSRKHEYASSWIRLHGEPMPLKSPTSWYSYICRACAEISGDAVAQPPLAIQLFSLILSKFRTHMLIWTSSTFLLEKLSAAAVIQFGCLGAHRTDSPLCPPLWSVAFIQCKWSLSSPNLLILELPHA